MSRSRVMRVAALVLAAVILPLAVFAAVSMGLRLDQYGLAPARLWGLVAIVVACVYGVGFWGSLVRGRRGGWAERMRQANFHLGLFVCAIAVLLALPIFDFGAISTRDQVARLKSGEVAPEEFDFSALRWDFGEPGLRALGELAKGTGKIAELAVIAQKQSQRPYGWAREFRSDEDFHLRVQPDDPALKRLVLDYLKSNPWACSERCVALEINPARDGSRKVAIVQGMSFEEVRLPAASEAPAEAVEATAAVLPEFDENATVEIRTVEKRYIFVDGEPLSQPLEDSATPLEGSPPRR